MTREEENVTREGGEQAHIDSQWLPTDIDVVQVRAEGSDSILHMIYPLPYLIPHAVNTDYAHVRR